MDSRRYLQ